MNNTLSSSTRPFRFFDNREKYLLFVTTCGEKWAISQRIGEELQFLRPQPPAIRVFDAGTGDGTVLASTLRQLHGHFPNTPALVVGKEISLEDLRLTLDKLPDRFSEHPQTVIVMTNIHYHEVPELRSKHQRQPDNWRTVALDGSCAHDFEAQIHQLQQQLNQWWQVKTSPESGNPIYDQPTILVLYRRDREFTLQNIIPRPSGPAPEYDLIIAAQPYRARHKAATKVSLVLEPAARALAPGGRLIMIQSTGQDPGMELIRRVWPNEDPFRTPLPMLVDALQNTLACNHPERNYCVDKNPQPFLRYHLHLMPSEISENIGASTLLAAWNAAIYVAQIDDARVTEAISDGGYLTITQEILARHGGLWFMDESLVLVRDPWPE